MEREKVIDTILYLLCLNIIDYWLHKWREEEVYIAHDNKNYMWHISQIDERSAQSQCYRKLEHS